MLSKVLNNEMKLIIRQIYPKMTGIKQSITQRHWLSYKHQTESDLRMKNPFARSEYMNARSWKERWCTGGNKSGVFYWHLFLHKSCNTAVYTL